MEKKIEPSKGIYALMKEEAPNEDKGIYHLNRPQKYEIRLYVGLRSYELFNKSLKDAWKKQSEQDNSSI